MNDWFECRSYPRPVYAYGYPTTEFGALQHISSLEKGRGTVRMRRQVHRLVQISTQRLVIPF